jgi:hypothetical protein
MPIPAKGLKNIRTRSAQITCLEMEKARRDRERGSTSRRIAEIDRRLADIDKVKRALLHTVSTVPCSQKAASGFKIRY